MTNGFGSIGLLKYKVNSRQQKGNNNIIKKIEEIPAILYCNSPYNFCDLIHSVKYLFLPKVINQNNDFMSEKENNNENKNGNGNGNSKNNITYNNYLGNENMNIEYLETKKIENYQNNQKLELNKKTVDEFTNTINMENDIQILKALTQNLDTNIDEEFINYIISPNLDKLFLSEKHDLTEKTDRTDKTDKTDKTEKTDKNDKIKNIGNTNAKEKNILNSMGTQSTSNLKRNNTYENMNIYLKNTHHSQYQKNQIIK